MRPAGAVVVAAGLGDRLASDRPKALVRVAGRPLVAHAVAALQAAHVDRIVVVHVPGQRDAFAAAVADPDVVLVPGGATRTGSVREGVGALGADVEVVVVHDAARALMPVAVIDATIAAVVDDVVAAAPAVAVTDTLKRVEGQLVVGTIDRAELMAVQTPQVFPLPVLRQALASRHDATDDLAPVERLLAAGELEGRIVVVAGSPRGAKITYPSDLVAAEAFAAEAGRPERPQ